MLTSQAAFFFFVQFYLSASCTRRIIQQSHQNDNKTPSSLITLAHVCWIVTKTVVVMNSPLCFTPVCMRIFTPSQLGDAVSCVVKAAACMNDLYSIRPIAIGEHSRTYTVKTLAIWLKVIKQSPSLLWPLSRLAEFPCTWSKNHEAMMSAKKTRKIPQAQLVEELRCPGISRGWRVFHSSCRSIHFNQRNWIQVSYCTICFRSYLLNFAHLTVKYNLI